MARILFAVFIHQITGNRHTVPPETLLVTFKHRLHALRELLHHPQSELRHRCLLAQPGISKMKSGALPPSPRFKRWLAADFDVSADYLIGREDHQGLSIEASADTFSQYFVRFSPARQILVRQLVNRLAGQHDRRHNE